MDNERSRVLSEIARYQPVPWESIPDLGLYMDQVITFITRAYEPLYGESTKSYLSAPMINNYVKNKLIPRPSGKKYSRTQIAMLIMIVSLKRVCMMEDIRAMISVTNEEDVQSLYAQFCARQQEAITQMNTSTSEISPAMDCAIFASAYRAGCEALLLAEMLKTEEVQETPEETE